MDLQHFKTLVKPVVEAISQAKIDPGLETRLNATFPPSSATFRNIENACHEAIKSGWMCNQGSEGRRFGRVLEPSVETDDLSIDVVDLTDIVGPHHRHPTGEVWADGAAILTSGGRARRHERGRLLASGPRRRFDAER